MAITGYLEAIRHLYGLTRFGIKPGLENTRRLAQLVGDPQRQLKFIHVAGTNGKGTTCAMLENICRHAGLRVGLYTSPHLISFRERIQVNRELIPEADLVRLLCELQSASEVFQPPLELTLFEFATVMALKYFEERECDLVVLETGLGGRFDSTNIVEPLVSVITPVSFDHQDWLGNTLEEIAGEKAGIIKSGVPVVVAAQEASAFEVIREAAAARGSCLLVDSTAEDDRSDLPANQRQNAGLAAKVMTVIGKNLGIGQEAVAEGLADVSWPGRFQRIEHRGQMLTLDGAHNGAGFRFLCQGLEEQGVTEPVLILGLLGDKDPADFIELIEGRFSRVLLVPIASKRAGNSADMAALAAAIRDRGVDVTVFPSQADALASCGADAEVVVTGSFYLIGEALELIGEVPAGVRSERELNELGR